MPRYKLTIEYDGTAYNGWQRQDDARTVQQAVEEAVFKLSGENAEVIGSGRTDSGVHALEQVAHVDIGKEFPTYKVMQGLNFYLLEQDPHIAVTDAETVDESFQARFSAKRRHYLYRILNRPARPAVDKNRVWHIAEKLDEACMQVAANYLVGHHDFTSFRDTQCQSKSPVKTLELIQVDRVGEEVQIRLYARSFLHHQVRIIAGTLWQVGTGRIQPDDVNAILQAKDRAAAGPTAPACGLYLVKVDY